MRISLGIGTLATIMAKVRVDLLKGVDVSRRFQLGRELVLQFAPPTWATTASPFLLIEHVLYAAGLFHDDQGACLVFYLAWGCQPALCWSSGWRAWPEWRAMGDRGPAYVALRARRLS